MSDVEERMALNDENKVALLNFSVFSTHLGPLDNVIRVSETYKSMIEGTVRKTFAINIILH